MKIPFILMPLVSNVAGLLVALALGGCVTVQNPFERAQPYMVLAVDDSSSCEAIAASFRFSARRAARLEYWLGVGPVSGFGYARFEVDAPWELRDEFRRMDALSDLQRTKGCRVMEPQAAVAYERARLEPLPPPQSNPPAVLRSKG
jgi:hypothetical protein